MSTRWRPPGYERLIAKVIEDHADGKKARFAELTGLRTDQVNRWVKSLPENHESLVVWAAAVGLSWQTIVTAEDAKPAASARPRLVGMPIKTSAKRLGAGRSG